MSITGFTAWLRAHRGAVGMAGLLAFAPPVRFFVGAVTVMRDPSTADIAVLAGWFLLFAAELWGLLLVIGYLLRHARYPRVSMIVGACVAAAVADLANGRGEVLVEQGVVHSTSAMHAYAFAFALIMALLFFAHLQRSRAQEDAAARLAAAQTAQHEARRRLRQAQMQAMQARIDPQFLFEMLAAVRRAYERDPARAERLLDELAAFLRAALPRLRATSSSVRREAQLAQAYIRLRALAGDVEVDLRSDVPTDAGHARFPPGVLLPLLGDALHTRASPELVATRTPDVCTLVLRLPARPLEAAVARVRELLSDLYGAAAEVSVGDANGVATATVRVPYERA